VFAENGCQLLDEVVLQARKFVDSILRGFLQGGREGEGERGKCVIKKKLKF
jgi:hypothetical protein